MHKVTNKFIELGESITTCKLTGFVTGLASGLLIVGCETERSDVVSAERHLIETDLVWAVNVGGPAFEAIDGTAYVAEESVTGGTVGQLEIVKGSQDPFLYQSYRLGDIEVARPIANGIYDITFHFAEPKSSESYAAGDRIFDAFAEDQRVIDDLDVMLARDG